MIEKYQKIYKKIKNLENNKDFLKKICNILKIEVEHYNWVGFYLIDKNNKNILILGPYSGKLTEHTKIEVGEGICGQAADKKETFEVPDVKKEDNYLSCSPDVKSEIVVPIFKNYEVIGEIDIDSHEYDPFIEDDRKLLNKIAKLVSKHL